MKTFKLIASIISVLFYAMMPKFIQRRYETF